MKSEGRFRRESPLALVMDTCDNAIYPFLVEKLCAR